MTWLELFFELTFVVVISRLAHHLSLHPDARALGQFALLFIPVWWTCLDDPTRELTTLVILSVNQIQPQLKAHTAALNVGVTPLEIREAVYLCAPFVCFSKTLNAVTTINEVFKERGIALPLPAPGTTSETDRAKKGNELHAPIYGDEIREGLKDLPESLRDVMPYFLTAF